MRTRCLPALAAVSLLPAAASASVVTYMDARTLTRLSPVIVQGTVRDVSAIEGGREGFSPKCALLGGRLGAREARVFGIPAFGVGEEVLLFATPAKAGRPTVTRLFQGKITIERVNGRAFAVLAPGRLS